LALKPNSGLGRFHETFCFSSVTRSRTIGRTPRTGDQLFARPLPLHKYKNAHTTQTLNIHALSGIRTYGPRVHASEDSSCLRPLGYRDRYFKRLDRSNFFNYVPWVYKRERMFVRYVTFLERERESTDLNNSALTMDEGINFFFFEEDSQVLKCNQQYFSVFSHHSLHNIKVCKGHGCIQVRVTIFTYCERSNWVPPTLCKAGYDLPSLLCFDWMFSQCPSSIREKLNFFHRNEVNIFSKNLWCFIVSVGIYSGEISWYLKLVMLLIHKYYDLYDYYVGNCPLSSVYVTYPVGTVRKSWSRSLDSPVETFLAFYGNRRFITVIRRTRCWILYW
jgi:hypothetical protein